MKKSTRLSVIASLLMGSGMVLATSMSADGKSVIAPSTRLYTVSVDSSLYQLALQSGITVAELRALNKGLEHRDRMKAGESLLLPINSPLFPLEKKDGLIASDLPELGMGNDPLPKKQSSEAETKASSAALLAGSQDWNHMTSDQVKNQAESWAKNQAKAQVVNPLQKGAQEFLGKFGKAQVNVAVDDKGNLNSSSASLFTPWYETEQAIAFSQVGIHGQDGRTISNLGGGMRFDHGKWLWGYNAFLDQDISRNHTRGGIGGELWTDNLRLATNYYHPLSSWKDSKDFDDYLERPAEGFDIRLQGYLPSYPQLGASVMYEQYFGDEVALFGKDNLQHDPDAITVGVDYTPVPLLTLKVSHREGKSGNNDSKADMTLNYQLGTPLKIQLDPDNVATARSLKGAMYDRVDRNYDIVLEYKEKAGVLDLDLAAVPEGLLEGDSYIMQPLVKSKYAITTVNWNGDVVPLTLLATAGENNPQGWRITLPTWDPSPQATNRYQLSITVTNEKGRQVTSNIVEVMVGQKRQGQLQLDSGAEKVASGLEADAMALSVYLTDHQGNKINDPTLTPRWIVKDTAGQVVPIVDGENCPTDAQGTAQPCLRQVKMGQEVRDGVTYYTEVLVSTLVGTYTVSADLGTYGITAPEKVTFSAIDPANNVAGAQILDPQGNDILAGHIAPVVGTTYTVKLLNAAGEDITANLPPEQLQWHLEGNAETAGCNVAPANGYTGITGTTFTPRLTTNSNSGVDCGDQGFSLKVVY